MGSIDPAGSSWPRGFQGVFTASIASIDDAEVSLLSFEDDKLPVFADDGTIKLTRRVVSVECEHGELKVSATTWCANDEPYAMTNVRSKSLWPGPFLTGKKNCDAYTFIQIVLRIHLIQQLTYLI